MNSQIYQKSLKLKIFTLYLILTYRIKNNPQNTVNPHSKDSFGNF